MSSAAPVEVAAAGEDTSLGGILRARWEALRAGDVGSLPVIVGLIAITLFFTSKTTIFFSAVNFSNLIQQMAGVTVIAIGVVFVLLIGEIDLSIGYVSGVAGVVVAELQLPGSSHQYPGLIAIFAALAVGAAIGAAQGSFIAFLGVPSFVVTLAGLLIWQGVILKALGTQGVIGIQDKQINDIANYVLTKNWGWAVAIVFTVGYAVAVFGTIYSRRRAGLPSGNIILSAARVVFFAALAFAAVAVCNHSRGVPLVGLIVLFLVVLGGYIAGRTRFGRHVYAVGGNAEAARRAGINVKLIKILVFSISGAMAAMGGIIFASRLNSVDLTAGGGTILLDAISAAVIGGVSLFGGRGRVSGALFGGLIIGMIANGIDLVGYTDAVKFITTGVILLAAVTLDTVARRRQAAAGR
ncbi:MAG: sugar ABC transporter permease [Actinomycetota bacterium]|nr:sugar ABC transporter permease [Actinomycetota bacterium]